MLLGFLPPFSRGLGRLQGQQMQNRRVGRDEDQREKISTHGQRRCYTVWPLKEGRGGGFQVGPSAPAGAAVPALESRVGLRHGGVEIG